MFETKEMPVLWDGRLNEREVMPGLHVYVVELEYSSGQLQVLSGDVTLVR